MKFHHVGVACARIDDAVAQFRVLHPDATDASEIVHDPLQNARLKLMRLPEGVHFEFISGGMVEGLVSKGMDLYHTCFETDDFGERVDAFRAGGALPLGPARPAILFGGRRVIFFKTRYGIVELLEEART